jgi:hypothetical protein
MAEMVETEEGVTAVENQDRFNCVLSLSKNPQSDRYVQGLHEYLGTRPSTRPVPALP